MDKEKNIAEEIKTKDDIKKFFRRMIDDKQAVADCIRAGRPLSDLKDRGIKTVSYTHLPSLVITLIIFTIAGLSHEATDTGHIAEYTRISVSYTHLIFIFLNLLRKDMK